MTSFPGLLPVAPAGRGRAGGHQRNEVLTGLEAVWVRWPSSRYSFPSMSIARCSTRRATLTPTRGVRPRCQATSSGPSYTGSVYPPAPMLSAV